MTYYALVNIYFINLHINTLFNKFSNNKEFCIKYKKIMHCDICNNDMKFFDKIIISDDEGIQLDDINSILKLRYSSHISSCITCIKNNIEANAYILVNNIDLPKIFIVSIELEGSNPSISIREDSMLKTQNYSKAIFNMEFI